MKAHQYCEVMKLAAMPSCLGGRGTGTNQAFTICAMANRPVQVRILPSQRNRALVSICSTQGLFVVGIGIVVEQLQDLVP